MLSTFSQLNHLKRTFVSELSIAPKLQKYKNDGKFLLDSWQKIGDSVISDQNIIKSAFKEEDL